MGRRAACANCHWRNAAQCKMNRCPPATRCLTIPWFCGPLEDGESTPGQAPCHELPRGMCQTVRRLVMCMAAATPRSSSTQEVGPCRLCRRSGCDANTTGRGHAVRARTRGTRQAVARLRAWNVSKKVAFDRPRSRTIQDDPGGVPDGRQTAIATCSGQNPEFVALSGGRDEARAHELFKGRKLLRYACTLNFAWLDSGVAQQPAGGCDAP